MTNLPNTSPAPQPFGPQPSEDPPEPVQEVGVPRRFGVGTLLVITAMYAVLFAVLRAHSWPPIVFVIVTLFFTAVGLGQMLLFKGKQPRRASMYVGVGFSLSLCVLGFVTHNVWGLHDFPSFDPVAAVIGGAMDGYLAGVLIAGVFLMIERVRSICRKFQGRG